MRRHPDADRKELATQLKHTLSSGHAPRRPRWRASQRTLRIAATTSSLWLTGSAQTQHEAVDPGKALGFEPFRAIRPVTVSVVVLARAGDQDGDMLPGCPVASFHDMVMVVDAAEAPPKVHGNLRYLYRPLAGHFADQRNAGTIAARGDWVFHLDTDETISTAFAAALGPLAAAAQRTGYDAVGFPRRNHVDGQLSNLFPDIQFRLMRRDIRFKGRVHERPATCRTPDRAIVSQHGVIDHRLCRKRVVQRSVQYDRLGQDRERHADDRALLAPFDP